jgi:uncharacterized protein (TIGR03790 family)
MANFQNTIVALLLFGWTSTAAATDGESLASRVLILANRDDPDSLRIAGHYAAVRGVPAENLIALSLPHAESITWREFVVTLWQPLLDELIRQRWIDAIPMTACDAVGRRKFAPSGHRIAALVVCRGVPLKLEHDPALYEEALPLTRRGEFRTNAGAVDAELSLLAVPNYAINAFVPNPLFQNESPSRFELAQVVKVARLDGPTVEDALALVDQAQVAERTGLLGRSYVDLSDRDPAGNEWLEAVAVQLAELGFDPVVDRAPATLAAHARFDAPVLYFGWYAGSIDGPFMLPGFRFPPGAIGLHIHSYSAATLRSTTRGWTGALVARGVTATVGNVHEPYLQFTHRPNLLLRALARGATWVDAAYYSLQALSWQAVVIGDPLYRPFAVPLAEQLRNPGSLPPRLAAYAVLRRMHQIESAGHRAEALQLGRGALRDIPNLALAVEVARRLADEGKMGDAASTLEFATRLASIPADEWALAREAARLLEDCGRAGAALRVWRAVFSHGQMPADLRLAWMHEACQAARAGNDLAQERAWQREIDLLTAPEARRIP